MKKIATFTILVLLSSIAHSQVTNAIVPDRPGATMSAFTLGRTTLQFETGIDYWGSLPPPSGIHTILLSDMKIRFGIRRRFETSVTAFVGPHFLVDSSEMYFHYFGLYNWRADVRFNVLKGKGFKPTISLQGGVNSSAPMVNTFVPYLYLLTNNMWERASLTANFGINFYPPSDNVSAPYAVKYSYLFSRKWGGLAEVSGDFKFITRPRVNLGFFYSPHEKLRFDWLAGIIPNQPLSWSAETGVSYLLRSGTPINRRTPGKF